MTSFEIIVILIFGLWLLLVLWFALTKSRPSRIRILLSRGGWLNRWTMFVPESVESSGAFKISYRDEYIDGVLGPWKEMQVQGRWHPLIFFSNPQIRLQGLMIQAMHSFSRMNRLERNIRESKYYNFFVSIVMTFELETGVQKRQIRVDQLIRESKSRLVNTDLLLVK